MSMWLVSGLPTDVPYACRCAEHGRALCGTAPTTFVEHWRPWGGGCPCWGRPWNELVAVGEPTCCGWYWRPAPARVA